MALDVGINQLVSNMCTYAGERGSYRRIVQLLLPPDPQTELGTNSMPSYARRKYLKIYRWNFIEYIRIHADKGLRKERERESERRDEV